MDDYIESDMEHRVGVCLKTIAKILDANKSSSIRSADSVPHQYGDKYLLANHLTNVSVVAVLCALEQIGVSRSVLATLKAWSTTRAISLKFQRTQKCRFIKEVKRDVEDPTRVQTSFQCQSCRQGHRVHLLHRRRPVPVCIQWDGK